MFKKVLILVVVLIIVVLAGVATRAFFRLDNNREPVACTEEAKMCPDGSSVSRQGPNCEFAQCSNVVKKTTGIIKGKVEVGPICPVAQAGVPCPVPPEAYTSREIILYAANGTTTISRMHFLANGTYSFQVTPGAYVLNIPQQGIGGSGDVPETIIVKAGQTVEFNFQIDTGIR